VTDDQPGPADWLGIALLNVILGVGAAIPLFPFFVVAADLAWGVDPTLTDDGLGVWMTLGVPLVALYAAVAVPLNLMVARRTGLRGQPWWPSSVVVTVAVAALVLRVTEPELWEPYATRLP
jgi:hypothetical protein